MLTRDVMRARSEAVQARFEAGFAARASDDHFIREVGR